MKFHWAEIQNIAKAHHCEDPVEDLESFARFLKFWWCRHFNRPFKDPLLKEYTLDELCYEFLRYYYLKPENDPKKELEAKSVREEEDEWIKAQMAKIAQAQTATPSQAPAAESVDKAPPELPEISTTFEE